MVQIAVDDQVFAELQRRAVVYVDKEPNDTLRRILGLHAPAAAVPAHTAPARRAVPAPRPATRKQKVQLSALVAAGVLQRGQVLYCVDYSSNVIPGCRAEVGTGNKLVRNGRRWSMSALAIELLRQSGHDVDVARGPVHWQTENGKTVLDLWREMRSASG